MASAIRIHLRELDNTVRLRFKVKPHPFVEDILRAAGFSFLYRHQHIVGLLEIEAEEYVYSAPWTERALELARELEA